MLTADETQRRLGASGRVLVTGAAATLLVGAVALLATGVDASELIRYGLYLLVFVLAPGIAAYLALMARPGDPVRVLALGWTFGIALVLVSFVLTAALGVRELLWAHPVVVLALAAPTARRRLREVAWDESPSAPMVVAAVGILALALVYLIADAFVAAPLPERAASVQYYVDNVWDIGVVAEAMHHWPLQHPSVAGEPLRYHLFAFLDMGATGYVSGVEPSTLVLRLFPVSMTFLSFLLMTCLGRRVGGRWSVGVLAGALLFLTGELDIFPRNQFPFLGVLTAVWWDSPTYVFGLPFFLAATLLVCDALRRHQGFAAREAVLFTALVAVGVGAKASVAPVLLGGLSLTGAWCLWRCRDRLGLLVGLSGVVLAVFIAGYVAIYSGGSGALRVKAFTFLQSTLVEMRYPHLRGRFLIEALMSGPTILLSSYALLAIVWMLARPSLDVVFLLALLAASLAPTLFVASPGAGQWYFLLYGVPPALVVAAAGLDRFWRWAIAAGVDPRRLLVAAAVVVAIAGIGAAWSWSYDDFASVPVLVVYAVVLVTLVVAAAMVAPRPRRLAAMLPIAAALSIAVSLADRPLDSFPLRLQELRDGLPMNPLDQPNSRGTTRALTDGLRWVRDNTPQDALLAVNNHELSTNGSSRYFYYSALAERRVFLESWAYTEAGAEGNAAQVFAHRRAVNDAALLNGDRNALAQLARRGVDYALIDRVHATGSPELDRAATLVFANHALLVYRLSSG